MIAGLCCVWTVAGCKPPTPPAVKEPQIVSVDVSRYTAYHPSAAQVKKLDDQIRVLSRTDLSMGRDKPVRLSAPAAEDLPAPAPAAEPPAPPASVDVERTEAAIRKDFAMRREAAPLPEDPDDLPSIPAPPPVVTTEPPTAPKAPEGEKVTGLDEQISKLNRQAAQLKETSQDRLIYTPAQLRRRRELLQVTRQELARLHAEQVAKLRAALQPTPKPPRPRPAPIVKRPRPTPAEIQAQAPRPASPKLLQQEAAALAAARETPPLPSPDAAPVLGTPPALSHEADRAALGGKIKPPANAGKAPPTVDRALYLQRLTKRRDGLKAAIRDDLKAAAANAGRREGLTVTFDGKAADATDRLSGSVREAFRLGSVEVRP